MGRGAGDNFTIGSLLIPICSPIPERLKLPSFSPKPEIVVDVIFDKSKSSREHPDKARIVTIKTVETLKDFMVRIQAPLTTRKTKTLEL